MTQQSTQARCNTSANKDVVKPDCQAHIYIYNGNFRCKLRCDFLLLKDVKEWITL